jgi:hypothetical protein
MEETKLKEFNAELKTLLDKYSISLQVEAKIVVVPNKPMEETTPEVVEEVTGTDPVETGEVTGTETPVEATEENA